jgi:predicted nucleotidyltransferase
MNIQNIEDYLYNQTPLRILSFLSLHPVSVLSAKEISQKTNASKGATHQTLTILLSLDILNRQKKGNLFLYKLNLSNPIIKQFKIFEIILKLYPLIKQIKEYCYQIILYGSSIDGTNASESDIDLFIKTDDKKTVQKYINKYSHNVQHINAAIYDPMEFTTAQKKDSAFFEQVKKGIIMWEGKPGYEED